METSEFLNSDEASTLLLRHEIFNAARLAFHIAMDKFIMAEFDVPEHEELLVSNHFVFSFCFAGRG